MRVEIIEQTWYAEQMLPLRVALSLSFLITFSGNALGLDIDHWLSKPGVKMVAVEFFATSCKPCIESVAKWRSLHDEYAQHGLRVIVVSLPGPYGVCTRPDWQPDEIICDRLGQLTRRFGVQGRLPRAFLWNWQGYILSQQSFQELQNAVVSGIHNNSKVIIDVEEIVEKSGIDNNELHLLIQAALGKLDKFTLTSTQQESTAFRFALSQAMKNKKERSLSCEGPKLNTNAVLNVSILGSNSKILRLELVDTQKACLWAGVSTRWDPANKGLVIGNAVNSLVDRLRLATPQVPSPVIKTQHKQLGSLAKASTPMVKVPAGNFYFGCNESIDDECAQDEKPGRIVSTEAFSIDRYEVTVEDYEGCVLAGRCSEHGLDGHKCNWSKASRQNLPMNCVSWHQAVTYCSWRSKVLPTEKEWEKAARGIDGRKYSWGNISYSRINYAVANINADRLDGYADGYAESSPVGSFPLGKSPYGAMDMMGNLLEWTASEYVAGQDSRVVRGGSWNFTGTIARTSSRFGNPPSVRSYYIGFRCVRHDKAS